MKLHAVVVLMSFVMAAGACARAPDQKAQGTQSPAQASVATKAPPAVPAAQPTPAAALPRMLVHKSPTCGCCELWVEHMRAAGFEVEVHNSDNLNPIKERLGVPYGHGSCHTAEVGGYFVEGHVPAADVKRLLVEKPKAKGLVLPGMPLGSPGMEVPSGEVQPYVVSLVDDQGQPQPYARH